MDIYEEVVRMRREGRRAALATIVTSNGSIPSFTAAKMLVCEDGSSLGTIGGGRVEAEVIAAAIKTIKREKPQTLDFDLTSNPGDDAGLLCGGELKVFIEPIAPAPLLYIFGAGHVGFSTYKIARMAGFEVVVVDDRAAYANRQRFPEAKEVFAEDWEETLRKLTLSEGDYVFIVTRGHQQDARVLRWAVDTPAGYIGMIGSRAKVATVFQKLKQDGAPAERLERVHAPVGLDIGATTPEEIAVAVTAEIIAFRRHSDAALPHMRDLRAPARTRAKSETVE
ncbi:conserved hypothetical protein [uncultured Alphaproteobacteria bacterium]|uniref:Xanthine dehydrogenase n=1 Tax=uncultured Alphaproteobacteria bacterium TaxID=91750 RepID=A0A212K3J5_9PROT|nr:conserved hypothetical protein [uncultured Alphaproteobacteria bacterium]